jgi:hypothetical protein
MILTGNSAERNTEILEDTLPRPSKTNMASPPIRHTNVKEK